MAETNGQEDAMNAKIAAKRERMMARLKQRYGKELEQPCDREKAPIEAAGVAGRTIEAIEFDKTFGALTEQFDLLVQDKKDNSIEKLQKAYKEMSQCVNERIGTLPSFDVRVAQERLTEYRQKLDEVERQNDETQLKQSSSFAFKKRDNKKTLPPKSMPSSNEEHCNSKLSAAELRADYCNLQSKSIVVDASKDNGDLVIAKCSECTFTITALLSTLHISDCTNCVFLCASVSTSVFVDNLIKCTLLVACQQLRMHRSKYCQLFLHVQSAGILESCTGINVAPYPLRDCLPDTIAHNTNYQHLKDFDWLAMEHSPNWTLVEEEEALKNLDHSESLNMIRQRFFPNA